MIITREIKKFYDMVLVYCSQIVKRIRIISKSNIDFFEFLKPLYPKAVLYLVRL